MSTTTGVLDSLEWGRKVDIAVAKARGWHLQPKQGSQIEGYANGCQLYDNYGNCLGWWPDPDDAWATGVLHFTSDIDTAIHLAFAERITVTPDFNRQGRQVWAAAACDLHGTEPNKTWVGILKPHDWHRSAHLPVAICLAVLDKYGVTAPEGRPEHA